MNDKHDIAAESVAIDMAKSVLDVTTAVMEMTQVIKGLTEAIGRIDDRVARLATERLVGGSPWRPKQSDDCDWPAPENSEGLKELAKYGKLAKDFGRSVAVKMTDVFPEHDSPIPPNPTPYHQAPPRPLPKLNPCAACGGEPIVKTNSRFHHGEVSGRTVQVFCCEQGFKSMKNYSDDEQKEEATRQAIEEWNIRNNHKAPPCPLPKLNRCAVCGREPKTLTSLYPGDYSGNKRDISIFCTGHCAVVKFCDIYTSEAAKAAAQRQAIEEWNWANGGNAACQHRKKF